MKAKPLPSICELRDAFIYDRALGVLYWRIKTNRGGKLRIGDEAGGMKSDGYRVVKLGRRYYQVHRIIWKFETGKDPLEQIDHINGNRNDNHFSNLREACPSENLMNMKKLSRNTSGYKGVCRNRCGWQAAIGIEGKVIYLGTFKSALEAHQAYRAATRQHFGEFARFE